jgi:tRNA nucleotidyltransferase/poly(A) polymerase
LHPLAIHCIQKLKQKNNKITLAVGGVVRHLLNSNAEFTSDIDIVTGESAETVIAAFSDENITQDTHNKRLFHFIKDNVKVDIFCSTHLENGDLASDAFSRDLTIGAVYADENSEILDPTGVGVADLQAGILDIIKPPGAKEDYIEESFRTDPIRMLRAIHFSAKYNYRLTNPVYEAIKNQAHLLGTHAALGQINSWIYKFIAENKSDKYFHKLIRLLSNLNIIDTVFPTLADAMKEKRDEVESIFHHESQKSKPSLTSVYDQLLAIADSTGDHQTTIQENALLNTHYSYFENENLKRKYSKLQTDGEKNWWLIREIFSKGLAAQNFMKLIETDLLTALFPSIAPVLKSDHVWLNQLMQSVNQQSTPSLSFIFANLLVSATAGLGDQLNKMKEIINANGLFKHMFDGFERFDKLIAKLLPTHPKNNTVTVTPNHAASPSGFFNRDPSLGNQAAASVANSHLIVSKG